MSEKQQLRAVLKTKQGESIRISVLSDAHTLALQAFNANLSDETRSRFLPHGYDEKTLAKYVARARNGTDRIYVALCGEELIGYFFLWEFQHSFPVLGIGIADAYQGQGLGKQMMTILIEDAQAAGCAGIELTTVPGNERAYQLYEKMGFRHVRDTQNIDGAGRKVREHVMFMALVPGAQPSDRDFGPPA